jgi:hypothetical protein
MTADSALAKRKSRFFAHHPRTCPKELMLFGAPETFGGPFAQNDGVQTIDSEAISFALNDSGFIVGRAVGGCEESKRRFFAHHPRNQVYATSAGTAEGAKGS